MFFRLAVNYPRFPKPLPTFTTLLRVSVRLPLRRPLRPPPRKQAMSPKSLRRRPPQFPEFHCLLRRNPPLQCWIPFPLPLRPPLLRLPLRPHPLRRLRLPLRPHLRLHLRLLRLPLKRRFPPVTRLRVSSPRATLPRSPLQFRSRSPSP